MGEHNENDKSSQVEPCRFFCRGVRIWSRYGQVREIVEMMQFVDFAYYSGVAQDIEEIFYNSKRGMCSFEFAPSFVEDGAVALKIREIARKCISQFVWVDMSIDGKFYDKSQGADS